MAGLLRPVAVAVAACWGRNERLVRTIAAESAIAGIFRTVRSAGDPHGEEWLDLACGAIAGALDANVDRRVLNCCPDAGPAIAVPARRVCCVLNTTTSCHSCPGCPRAGTRGEREHLAARWMASLDDAEFVEVTGRPKITGGDSPDVAGIAPRPKTPGVPDQIFSNDEVLRE